VPVVVTPRRYVPVVRADGRGVESEETKVIVERRSFGDRAYNVGDGKDRKEGERPLCNCVEGVGFGSFRTWSEA